jgi:hypothetical protein
LHDVYLKLPSTELVPVDFFMPYKLKNHLPGKTLTQETPKKEWEGGGLTLATAAPAAAFRA